MCIRDSSRCAVLLAVSQNAAVFKLHIARIPLSVVAEYGHHSQLAATREFLLDGGIIAWQIGIAIHHEKALAQLGQCASDCTSRTQQGRTIIRVFNLYPENAAIPDSLLNHLAQMADAQYDLSLIHIY